MAACIEDPKTIIDPPPYPKGGGSLPPGGATGQVLTKASPADGDAIWADGGGGGGSLLQPITASVTVGGVTAGTPIPAGTSFEDLFRRILAPALNPTLTDPSASLAVSGAKLREKGSSSTETATFTFNRGSINPAYGTSGYRSGAATGYTLNGDTASSATRSVQVNESNTTFSGSVSYAAGEQPKNSAGGNYGTPLPAGSKPTNTVTFEFVYALWATTVSSSAATKQALVSMSTGVQTFVMSPMTAAEPAHFDVPAAYTVTAVENQNELSGQWTDDLWEWDVSDTTHTDAAGNTVAYKRYTDNRGASAGSRSIRVKWR